METILQNEHGAGVRTVEFTSKEENLHYPGVLDIDPLELAEKMQTDVGKILIVDVRQKEEFNSELGHIRGSLLRSLERVPAWLKTIPQQQTIVFVCRSGVRSARAAEYAMGLGYESVYNMKGGMLLWNELKLEIEK